MQMLVDQLEGEARFTAFTLVQAATVAPYIFEHKACSLEMIDPRVFCR
jgi:hypothetical protein